MHAGPSGKSGSKTPRRSSVLDVRLGSIAASREFVVPATVLVLPGDARGLARHDLLSCRAFRCSVGLIMGGEGLGEDVAHLVGPSAVMFDDLVADLGHEWLLCRSNQSLEPSEKVAAKSGGNLLVSSDGGQWSGGVMGIAIPRVQSEPRKERRLSEEAASLEDGEAITNDHRYRKISTCLATRQSRLSK